MKVTEGTKFVIDNNEQEKYTVGKYSEESKCHLIYLDRYDGCYCLLEDKNIIPPAVLFTAVPMVNEALIKKERIKIL